MLKIDPVEFIELCPKIDDPALGLPGEVGEVLELIKKDRRSGEFRQPINKDKLTLEFYDVFFYLTRLMNDYNISWTDVLESGQKKLTKRFNLEDRT